MCRINCDSNFLLTSFDSLKYKTSLSLWHVFEYSVTTEHQNEFEIVLNFSEMYLRHWRL